MKKIATRGNYNLYQNKLGQYELWFVNSFMGYVSDPENLSTAIDQAEEDIRCLMAEVV
jgi:hypothetical protein